MGFQLDVSVSVLTVFLQGMISFFSPCVLPLLPLYIGYLSGGTGKRGEDGRMYYDRKKVMVHTLCFVIGISFTFFVLGLGVSALGQFFKSSQTIFARIGGVVIILIGLYWILAITCLLTKDSIKKTEQINMEKTSFIKDLRVALAALPLQTEDQPLKKKLQELSDDAKFSDPVSSELLEEVEARLLTVVTQCREALDKKDTEAALALCDKASRILKERNETCKILKRNQ